MRERGAPPGRGLATVHAAVARGEGATALSPTITSTGPPASRGAECGGDARSLRRRRTRSLPDARARASRAARPRPRRSRGREGTSEDAPRRDTSGGGGRPPAWRSPAAAPRSAARFRSPPRTVGEAAQKPPVAGAAATSPLPWKRIPPWKATRTRRRCFRSRRRRARRRRGRARPASRFAADADAASRAAARPARRAAGARRDPDADRPEARERQPEPSCSIPEWTSSERPCFPRCAALARRRRRPPRPSRARVCGSPARLGRARLGLVGGVDAHGGGHGRGRVEVGDAPVVLALLRARKPGRRVQRVTDAALPVLVRGQVPRPEPRLPNVEGPKSVSETAEARFVPCGSFARFRQNREGDTRTADRGGRVRAGGRTDSEDVRGARSAAGCARVRFAPGSRICGTPGAAWPCASSGGRRWSAEFVSCAVSETRDRSCLGAR